MSNREEDQRQHINSVIHTRLQGWLESISSTGFAREISERLSLDTVDVTGVELIGQENQTRATRTAQSTVTLSITVTEDMCNPLGNLHGGCGAWLVDHCSSFALLALAGDGERWTTSGVSTNLNLNYLKAAPIGTRLKIVTEVLNFGRVTSLLETKIFNAETNQLLTVGWHTKQDPQVKSTSKAKL
ncbi:PaaI family thioesterase [Sporobolomyces koalae]|uniref:PaaI family thioesterase n=1 Tax=Sporobolomyces koalae TaxID=500713 RepID=UPI003178768B